MPYTFGGANTDDLTLPVVTSITGPSVSGMLLAWVFPTTLTPGRGLAGFGNNLGRILVSATSGEIDVALGAGTTDGVWTSSGLALTADTWRFLAIAWTAIAGPTMEVRLWAGDGVTPPEPVTMAQAIAPVGTFSSQTTMTIGSTATSSSLAWQGDIGPLDVISTNIAAGATHPFGQTAYGAFATESVDMMFSRFVRPIWEGSYRHAPVGRVVNNTTSMQHVSLDMLLQGAAARHIQTSSANESIGIPTYNGATVSARAAPRARFSAAGMNARVPRRR